LPIFLCYDSLERQTQWSLDKYNGMTREFAKRRIKYYNVYSPDELKEYLEKCGEEKSSIVFFPTNESKRKYFFDRYGEFDIHKILFSCYDGNIAANSFSSVVSDFYGDMKLAISHLREKGCKKIALFNASAAGYHDKLRIDTYSSLVYHDPLIFYAEDNIYTVYSKLLACSETIDAIICTNDFSAFWLMLVLDKTDKDWNKKILLLSFSDTVLSSLCTPSLSSISLNYLSGGREIATIHNLVKKHGNIAYMHVVMKSHLSARDTTKEQCPKGMVFSERRKFSREEIAAMTAPRKICMPLEKLLALCDVTDLKILHGLILSKTARQMGTELYLSYDTVKYRIKKYKDALGINSSAELSLWLGLWIDPANLERLISKTAKS